MKCVTEVTCLIYRLSARSGNSLSNTDMGAIYGIISAVTSLSSSKESWVLKQRGIRQENLAAVAALFRYFQCAFAGFQLSDRHLSVILLGEG